MAAIRESSFCDKQQNDGFLLELFAQKQEGTMCDVILKVCGHEVYAHSPLLAAASPYFKAFLSQDLPRQYSQRFPQVIEIQIDGSDSGSGYDAAVSKVVDFIYTGRLVATRDDVAQVAEIARILQIQSVVNFCELFQTGKASPRVEAIAAGDSEPHRNITSKLRRGQLVSNSTQVNPHMLGLEQPTRDARTQTVMKDFPRHELDVPDLDFEFKKRRGRKPVIAAMARAAEAAADETGAVDTKEDDAEGRVATATDDITNEEAEIIVSIINPGDAAADTPSGVRRSGRARKPTAKVLHLTDKRPNPTPLPPAVKSPKLQGTEDATEAMAIEDSSPVKTTPASPKNAALAISSPSKAKVTSAPPLKTKDGAENSPPEALAEKLPPEGVVLSEDKPEVVHVELSLHPPEGATAAVAEAASLLQNPDAVAAVDQILETVEGEMKVKILSAKQQAEQQDAKMAAERERRLVRREKRKGRRPNPPKCRCSECGFSTNKIREMVSHRKLHQLAKNACIYCDREFGSKDELAEHMERHKGPLPYFCHFCDYRFRNKTQLNIHLPKHSDEKPFQCMLCPSSFKWRHALKSHMIVHSNKKDHLCDICGYASAHKSQLRAHKLIHTGATFKCDVHGCTFQATKKQNLKYHMLSHTREKPHVCEVCGHAFSFVKNLRRHMKLHSVDKPHTCSRCEYASTRFDKLKEHELKAHGIGTPPEKRMRVADMVLMHKMKQMHTITETGSEGQHVVHVTQEGTGDPMTAGAPGGEVTMLDIVRGIPLVEGAPQIVQQQDTGGTMEFLPGQTIIIQQTNESGEIQGEIALPIGPAQPVTPNLELQGQNLSEIMIPANQVAEYMQKIAGQQLTIVTQQE